MPTRSSQSVGEVGTTATGQLACSTTATETEPNSIRDTRPAWCAPTTSRFILLPMLEEPAALADLVEAFARRASLTSPG